MSDRLLTPSKITAWLGCAHYLTLNSRVEAGQLSVAPTVLNSLAEILVEKGNEHEANCLDDYESLGKSVYEVPGRNRGESFTEWVQRVGNPLELGYDVIYQMPFVHEGIRGIADFLVRNEVSTSGYATYEPVDAKLTRSQAKPGHVLQLCFYAEAIEALVGAPPRQMHIWLGSGTTQALMVEEFLPYWRRLRRQLSNLLSEEVTAATRPKPCESCEYCEFQGHCERQWREEDSLAFVANSRPAERDALENAGVRTLVALSRREEPVAQVRDEKLSRLTRQALLQVVTREAPDDPPAFEVIEPGEDPVYGHGFELLPAPDDGDVFFDFEGDPFWSAQNELMFLAGLYYRSDAGEWTFDARWAHTLAEQQEMISGLVDFFARRRAQFPGMHVYHYNHTERSTIERLMRDAPDENLFASLVDSGLFVDLFTIAKNAVRVGTESYGLKHLEHLVQFVRSGGIEQGAGAVVEYEQWMDSGDDQLLENIAAYNRDDVRSTMALRDWLVAQRPADMAWRDALVEQEDYELDTDELVERLHEFAPDTPEHLLGDLLNYWRRERSADVTPKFVALNGDYTMLYDNLDYLTNLSLLGMQEPAGREKLPKMVLSWPEQVVDQGIEAKDEVLYAGVGVPYGHATVADIDYERREISLRWGKVQEERGGVPAALIKDRHFRPGAKAGALKDLARQVLGPDEHGAPGRLAMALLAAQRPRFSPGHGPRGGVFDDDLESIYRWVEHLDESFVAIQGPPGTGKTYSGSHIIHHLIGQGLRVGVLAMSHGAIDNLMRATLDVFDRRGDASKLRALRWLDAPREPLGGVTYSKKKSSLTDDDYNLIGATAWLWASPEMRQFPVDVLLVDEAGQLSLADAVAATGGARNMLLLGDPLQLAQVAKAEHPGRSGASVLEHILGEHVTVPPDHGVFISETWRMHPHVCDFISRQIYEGRLTSNHCCEQQTTEFGTGLRWLRAHHVRRATSAPEEVDVVLAQITAMMGTSWTNQNGDVTTLTPKDFMVVAPYNDQVKLIDDACGRRDDLRGVQVGTVDKFQGREAPVVFFTMTTSSGEDMPRGPEFLFSRHRLNVAVSRARCLAYLVCTEELLNSRAHDIEDMRLISTLSAFVEHAKEH
ncbi:MAG: TM0106 family RecB-like putative nuclease [Acidobacteria bacterium]|nr:TM0106 family RecB-like putative nuclease [Acidobacteriota bacterium]